MVRRGSGAGLKTELPSFASKPAPTLDLCHAQIPCGSGLAREEALKNTVSINPAAKLLSHPAAPDHERW
ncbi:hypothetical protein FHG55_12960 [Pseudomonas jessenii]|uniref:Uncharacterized protein n=1 Tax=Pseudomonas jessenii TaxID=77298 RepID=A0A5C4KZS4_PSEJE|nr:hypothetical protein FHG55_12960 [Pseudomonas jessenii]